MKKSKSMLAIGLAVLAAFAGDFCAGLLREGVLLAHAVPAAASSQPQDVLINNIKAHRNFFAKLGEKRELFTASLTDYADQKILGVTALGKDRIGVAFLDDYGIQETVVFDTNSGRVLKRDSTILNQETRLAMRAAGCPVSDAYYLARQQPEQAQDTLLVKEVSPTPAPVAAKPVAAPVASSQPVVAAKPTPQPIAAKTSAMPNIEDFIYNSTTDELVAHLKAETGWVSKVEREKRPAITAQESVTVVSVQGTQTLAVNLDDNKASLRIAAENKNVPAKPTTVAAATEAPAANSELVKKIVEHREFFSRVNEAGVEYFLNPDKYLDYRIYNVSENIAEKCITVVFLSPTGEQEFVIFDEERGKPLYRHFAPLSESSRRAMKRNSIPIMDARFLAQNIKGIRPASMTAKR